MSVHFKHFLHNQLVKFQGRFHLNKRYIYRDKNSKRIFILFCETYLEILLSDYLKKKKKRKESDTKVALQAMPPGLSE